MCYSALDIVNIDKFNVNMNIFILVVAEKLSVWYILPMRQGLSSTFHPVALVTDHDQIGIQESGVLFEGGHSRVAGEEALSSPVSHYA